MANVSTLRKLGVITRVAARQAGGNPFLSALWRASQVTVASVGRVLQQLWLEVTGFIFLAIAGIGAFALARELAKYQAGSAGPGRMLVAIAFTLTFTWFGASSFWRVHRKNRQR